MHVYMYARGIYNQVELWKAFMQTQWWQFRRTKLDTKEEQITLVQGGLRPSILGSWEYIIPEDCLAEFIAAIGVDELKVKRPWDFKMSVLRRIIGCKPIPKKIIEEASKIKLPILINGYKRGLANLKMEWVAVHIIGIKEDEIRDCPEWGFRQERL